MKKHLLILLIAFSIPLFGQEIREIILFQNSGQAIVNMVIEDTYVSINTDGKLLSLNQASFQNQNIQVVPEIKTFSTDSDSDFDYTNQGNPFPLANQKVVFYNNFYDYKSGKLKSVNQVNFDYYNNFYSYQIGKLESVGKVKFTYYNDFYSYNTGKINSIDTIKFEYFNDFYEHKTGKLKSIRGNHKNIKIIIVND